MALHAARAVALALLSVPLVAGVQRFIAETLVRAEQLGRGTRALFESPVSDAGALLLPEDAGRGLDAGSGATEPRPMRKTVRVPGSIRISEAVVARLVRQGQAPHGTSISAQGTRPPGIRLRGVSALGIGVLDGDLLFEVDGARVQERAQVVSLVASALGRGQRVISARLYRGTTAYELWVEIPDLDSLGDLHHEGADVTTSPVREIGQAGGRPR